MPSQVFNEGKRGLLAGEIDLNADDIRIALVMTNTTVDTENDGIAFLGDFTTLDRCDSTGYSDAALANESVTKDDPSDEARFDADDVTFTALAADASRNIQGVLVYKFVTNDAASIPICYIEYTTAKTADGSDFVVKFHADGILKAA